MNFADLSNLAHECGAKAYSEPPLRAVTGVCMTYAQLADLTARIEEKERKRCCSIIWGYCSSDNVAQRTVDAIWKQPKT
jgi:hypothetical protein